MNSSLKQKRKRNRIVVAAAVVAAAVAVTARNYKKTGHGKETRKFREPMEMKTGWRMMNATDKWRTNSNIDLNYISPQHNTPHKPSSSHLQQHSPSPPLVETLAILRTISPGDPRGNKEREPESIQPKLQQYVGLMDVIERFHEITKSIIEKEKIKPKTMLPGQYKHYYPYKDGHLFFYPPKNYHPTPIPRPKDQDLSEEQWEQFDGDKWANLPKGSYIPGLLNISDGMAGFINIHPQIYQSIPDAVIADGTNDNENNEQSEHAIEPKHFTNGNDGLRKNDSGTQLHATVYGEANPEINITKTSANTPPHNVNGSDGLGGNGCGTQLQVATNENGHENHQAIDNTGNEDNNEQANNNRIGGQQQNNQGSYNEIQHEQDSVNNKPGEIRSPHTAHSKYLAVYPPIPF
ncbi:MAG: hypothetical protein EZS28_031513 [Streblomastix strix]|uniref:Uncharacterized protein n=1 Tax=Streblomastix strix TaxID=222440 RepID=A0A5J4URF7_9EUKA|nr:MAG: hypothetical protein EZS28_031513 [Streblomastix strix]